MNIENKWSWYRAGVLKFGFGRAVPSQNLNIWIYMQPNFGPNFEQIARFLQKFLIWANFGLTFGKFWKIDPLIYQILCFIIVRGHSYIKTGWFCYPCWQHIPVVSFALSTAPFRPTYYHFCISMNDFLWTKNHESLGLNRTQDKMKNALERAHL